eukprot:Sspe_Gene.2069::Locus_687_Transcript_1_1_Confidence_1.000_Length_1815::g.2069::m.2069/K16911/DDX21; ATP-dependent RNA helicase DDX21
MKNIKTIDLVGDSDVSASTDVRHIAISHHHSTRASTVSDVIAMYTAKDAPVLVFCPTKSECNDLAVAIRYDATALHGDVPQATREKTLESFRKGKFRVLVATDVAARGLDMRVDLVIQVRPPETRTGYPETETYVHRSGRTGRAGKKGICVTLYTHHNQHILGSIEKQTGNTFEWTNAPRPEDVMAVSGENTAEDALKIPDDVVDKFRDVAGRIIKKKGDDAQGALAAMIALASGHTEKLKPRSLLSNEEGYVTMLFTSRKPITALGYVWGALRGVLPAEACSDQNARNVRYMQVTEDGYGAVFDVKESLMPYLKEAIEEQDWLSVATSLPALKQRENGEGSNFFRGKGNKGDKGRTSSAGRG